MLDEVISPTMTIKVAGLKKNGLKSYIFNKINKTIQQLHNILCTIKFSITNILYKLINQLSLFFPNSLFFFNKNNNSTIVPFSRYGNKQNGLKIEKRSFHSSCRAVNRIGPHNEDVIAVLIGLLLGDGYANNRSGEGVRFSIRQSIIHKDYLFSLYEFFLARGYCSNLEPRKYTRSIKGVEKIYYGYEFNTYTFSSLYWLYSSFYKNGKKIVPQNLENFITALTLAIWISDDGTYTQYGVRIATNSFTLSEVEYLKNLLTNKFGLNCTVQKIYLDNKYSIYIQKESMNRLKELILPHLDVSIFSKLRWFDPHHTKNV